MIETGSELHTVFIIGIFGTRNGALEADVVDELVLVWISLCLITMINASHGFLQIQSLESFHKDVTQVKQMCFTYQIYSEQFVLSPKNETIISNIWLGNWTVKAL